jgi:hypothetical protein
MRLIVAKRVNGVCLINFANTSISLNEKFVTSLKRIRPQAIGSRRDPVNTSLRVTGFDVPERNFSCSSKGNHESRGKSQPL